MFVNKIDSWLALSCSELVPSNLGGFSRAPEQVKIVNSCVDELLTANKQIMRGEKTLNRLSMQYYCIIIMVKCFLVTLASLKSPKDGNFV